MNSVPTVIFVVKDRIFKKIIGAQPEDIIETCTILSDPNFKVPEEISLNDRLKSLTNRHKLMIFIKGTPTAPKCGFTSTLLRHLANLHVEYDYFDILSDNDVRQGLKEYSNWPTYPQVYVNGELIGGLDIFTELMENGQLDEILVTIK